MKAKVWIERRDRVNWKALTLDLLTGNWPGNDENREWLVIVEDDLGRRVHAAVGTEEEAERIRAALVGDGST